MKIETLYEKQLKKRNRAMLKWLVAPFVYLFGVLIIILSSPLAGLVMVMEWLEVLQ